MVPKYYPQHSPLIQWAYLFEDVRPLQTSTCALFWRSVVVTPVKVLGPALVVGFCLVLMVMFLSHQFAPEWAAQSLPLWMQATSSARDPFPWRTLLAVVGVIGVVAVIFVALDRLGVCKPVEIEGGLVLKGSCPKCAWRMAEVSPREWVCRKCHGSFVPPLELATNADAVDPHVTK